MTLRFYILVLRLLVAIYHHQLMSLNSIVEFNKRREILLETNTFINFLVKKEKEENYDFES